MPALAPPAPAAASDAVPDDGVNLPRLHEALRSPAWHLVFAPALEARMEADEGRERSRQMVLAGLAALAVFDLFLVNDWLVRPETFPAALWYRLGLMTGCGGLVLWLIHRGLPARWREGLLAAALTLGMFSACEIFRLTRSPAASYDPFAFSLVFLAGNIVFPLRFRPAVFSSAASLLLATLYVLRHPLMAPEARQYALCLMAGTAIFTCLACYRMERAGRQAYLLLLQEALRSQTALRMADEFALASQTDALTGLPNRRAFDSALQRRWHEALVRGGALALLLVDVDHFKRYNDHYGHPAGDACLQQVAKAMAAMVREGDQLARIGGEEFALLLADGRGASTAAAAERLCQGVRDLGLPHAGVAERAVVTVSVGAAMLAADDAALPDTLVAQADRALYQAKQAGRNRWTLASDPGLPVAVAERRTAHAGCHQAHTRPA